jgi:hypothetical protein
MSVLLSKFLPDVSIELPGCPEMLIEHHAIRVLADFCMQTRILTETLTAINVKGGVSGYEVFPEEFGNQLVRIEHVEYMGVPLDPVTVEELDSEVQGWRTSQDVPRIYTEENGLLLLVPIPSTDAAGGLSVRISFAPDPVFPPRSFPDILYQRHADGIAAGIKSRLMMHPGQAWTNPGRAETLRREYLLAIATAKTSSRKNKTAARSRSKSHYR